MAQYYCSMYLNQIMLPYQTIWLIWTISTLPDNMVDMDHIYPTRQYGRYGPYLPYQTIWSIWTISTLPDNMVDMDHIYPTRQYGRYGPYLPYQTIWSISTISTMEG